MARHPAEIDFRVREDRTLVGDTQIACEGKLRPGASGRPGDRGDGRLREMFEGPERILAAAHFILGGFRREPGPLVHVESGTEIGVSRSREDGRPNRIVLLQVGDPRGEVRDHREAQEIPGRILDPQYHHGSLPGDTKAGRVGHRAAMGSCGG